MQARAITTLAKLSDGAMFSEIAHGLTAIHENASRIADGMKAVVEATNLRAARILEALIKEEAAKYLLLIDAVRCPREPEERLTRQLEKFYEHLAKGLYAEVCTWRPVNFREVRQDLERESVQYYLDGPNDVDWIFQNWIIRQREEAFYVDYIANDDTQSWISPKRYDVDATSIFYRDPPVVMKIVDALNAGGFANPESLEIIAAIWRPFTVTDDSHIEEIEARNSQTLDAIERAHVVKDPAAVDRVSITSHWPFPLYDLPMKKIPVSQSRLREIQARWYPA